MIVLSKIINSFIEKGQRLLKINRFGKSDSMNVFSIGNFGEDQKTPKDYKGIYLKTTNNNTPVLIGVINKLAFDELKDGEKKIYSTDSKGDNISSYINLLNDGIIEFNGNKDFITGFTELNNELKKLKSDFNNLVSMYNAHIHITTATVAASATPGVISPTTSTATNTAFDIANAKKEKLKTM